MEDNNTEEGLPAEAETAAGKNGGMGGKIVGLVIVVLVIALGVYALTRGNGDSDGITPEAATTQNEEAVGAPASPEATAAVPAEGTTTPETSVVATGQTVTVAFTDAGYAPASVTIKKGDYVMFKNESSLETWPATAMHPTHTVYPGSDIQKCGTAEAGKIFDACRGLKNGETWSFQFNNVGKWNYHDHINLGKYGSIEVTE